jgi:hypothetical protein
MGAMEDYQLTPARIEQFYDPLCDADDDDVVALHSLTAVLNAAKAVMASPPTDPSPYPRDLALYALKGAVSERQELREFWARHGIDASRGRVWDLRERSGGSHA